MEILSVGVIGAGNIGTSHARSLSREVAGAQVSWLYDADVARANALADEIGARVAPTVEQLIASSDAVVIASPDALHAEQALICLDAQRPTLCEKPLAPTVSEATSVVDAEIAKETDAYPETQYDPAVVDAARAVFEARMDAIVAATTHEDVDALLDL